jgi:hypothetical protein
MTLHQSGIITSNVSGAKTEASDPLFVVHRSGLPDFSWYNIPKTGKNIPKREKYTK